MINVALLHSCSRITAQDGDLEFVGLIRTKQSSPCWEYYLKARYHTCTRNPSEMSLLSLVLYQLSSQCLCSSLEAVDAANTALSAAAALSLLLPHIM